MACLFGSTADHKDVAALQFSVLVAGMLIKTVQRGESLGKTGLLNRLRAADMSETKSFTGVSDVGLEPLACAVVLLDCTSVTVTVIDSELLTDAPGRISGLPQSTIWLTGTNLG